MKGLYLLAVATAIVLAACNGKKNEPYSVEKEKGTTVAKVKTTERKAAGFYGTYKGTLPCADCGGIKTTLKINDDTTYELKSEYLGEKGGVFEESGVYRIVSGNVIELITPSSGEKTYYKILDGALAMSDSTGNTVKGELAEHYILKKQ